MSLVREMMADARRSGEQVLVLRDFEGEQHLEVYDPLLSRQAFALTRCFSMTLSPSAGIL